MNTDRIREAVAMATDTSRKVTKLAIRQIGNKHYLYAYTGPVSKTVIGSYASFEEAFMRLDSLKKLIKEN